MECIICSKPISKKARTCSAKCKQIAYRNRDKSSTVTDLESCRYCNKPLPALAKHRRWSGACLDCAVKAPRRPSVDSLGELVYAGSERPTGD